MFLLLWYSPPDFAIHGEGYVPATRINNRKIIFVFDDRKVLREDEEILLLKP